MKADLHDIGMKNLKRSLTLRFIFLLLLFMVLLVASFVVSSRAISTMEHDSSLLNIAGRQRMLIRQYVSETNQALVGLATSNLKMALSEKKKADRTTEIFEKTHKVFLYGGEVVSGLAEMKNGDEFPSDLTGVESMIIPPEKNEGILEQLNQVEKEWQELKRIASLSLRSNIHSVTNSAYIHTLLDQATKTVIEMDHVVLLMQRDSETRLMQLRTILLTMVIIGTVLFSVLVYFVYSRIVLPLDSSIRVLRHTTESLEMEKIRAERANIAKSEFLSHMSHELRTPLNAILGFAQLLETEELDKFQRESVGEIIRAGGHLLTLINDVLDLAKVEAGNIGMLPEPVLFRDLLMESLPLVSSMAKERDISIRLFQGNRELALEAIEGIDDIVLHADRTRLKQVILNLLSNAIKYNRDHGWIEIHCNKQPNGLARISINDSGLGITAEHLPHTFSSFSRMGAEKSNIEGTGIGLVICKHIVESMNGTIGVESEPGKGSQFWIELPLDNSTPLEEKEEDQSTLSVQQLHVENIAATVLYIEDNPANLKLVESLMHRREGVRFLAATHPIEGLALAEEHRPDLILLDINLPEMDGYEVLKRLHALEGMKEAPVIAISANVMPRDIKKGIEAGFREYLTKPLDITQFFKAVDKVLY